MTKSKGKIPNNLSDPENLMPKLRRFILYRNEDISGNSGTGVVASGVIFNNGHCAMCWNSLVSSIAIFSSVADVEMIHGHNGATELRILED